MSRRSYATLSHLDRRRFLALVGASGAAVAAVPILGRRAAAQQRSGTVTVGLWQ
jgi:hypothetical protein